MVIVYVSENPELRGVASYIGRLLQRAVEALVTHVRGTGWVV